MQRRFSTLLACAALAWQVSATAQGAHSEVERQTRFGPVVGLEDPGTGTYAWKGIPFAKAPSGDLRWKAPVDPDTSPFGIKATQAFGNACVQYGRIYGPGSNNTYDQTIATTLNQAVGSEDCLYLNVWRPATGEANLPVIVFIHGGSDVSGYTADPVYDGAALAKAANAVVVTANYRVGIFGWLNLPQLKDGSSAADDSGNFGILDSIKALQYVNANIGSFGGDAGNVTLMGQSAGAINVYAILTSPLMVSANPKLFHKVVPLSGGISQASNLPAGSIPTLSPASTYLAQGNALLYNQLIVDGKATDTASAQAYVADADGARSPPHAAGPSRAALDLPPLARCRRDRADSQEGGSGRPDRDHQRPAITSRCRCSPATPATRPSCFRPSSRCRRRSAA
jgi:para-nitrobenzyl esterase